MGGEVEETMPEAEEDSVGAEVGGGVVAEEFGVAEDEAGAGVVEGVPGYEGKDGDEERDGPGEVGDALGFLLAGADELEHLPCGQGEGSDDGGLFGEDGEREEGGGPELGRKRSGDGGFESFGIFFGVLGGEVGREGPEGEGGGEDVGVGEGALGEPDGVEGGEEGGDDGYC